LANHKSAIKRIRQSLKRRDRNRHVRTRVRGVVKNFRLAVEGGDSAEAAQRFREAERELRKAASKGVLPKRRVDRSVGRLAKRLQALQANA